MVARVQRSSSARPAGKAAAARVAVRRRRPRAHPGRILLLSGLLAAAVLCGSSRTVDFGDVAGLFDAHVAPAQRWLARLVATPSGRSYLPTVATAPADGGYIVHAKLDVAAATGLVSAPVFVPPTVNRSGKGDLEMTRPPVSTTLSFAAGLLPNSGAEALYAAAATAPQMAFAMPQAPAATQLAAAEPQPKDVPKPVARPTVAVASIAPLPGKDRGGDTLRKSDMVVSAYANPDPADAMEAPFKALLNQPMAIGKDGKPDHWWVTNPIPPNARSPTEQKCLATAIYFEARGEPIQGELAVAQVVINRLKNPAYPNTICGVVYQNRDMRNACQFSFACDGIPDRITDASSWRRAQELAKRVLFRQDWWNKDVGSATHYHATYVRPRWARTMKKMDKIGHHVFYKTYGGGWI